MRRRSWFAALLFSGTTILATSLHAQQAVNATVAGKVTDAQTARPLEAVTIAVQGTQFGAVTGPDGTYRITRVPAGARIVAARRLGYGASTRSVTASDGQTVTV